MTEENEPLMGSGRTKGSRGDPDAADEIAIPDYVMLDFVDEALAPRKNAQRVTAMDRGATTRRGS